MKKKPTLDRELYEQSLISAKQIAYSKYKTAMINYYKYTWIGSNGEMVVMQGDFKKRCDETWNEFVLTSAKLDAWRSHYNLPDDELVEGVENGFICRKC